MGASLALRSIESAFRSDVQGAIALLRRALTTCAAPSDDAPYLTDMLAQYLVSTGDFEDLARILRACSNVPAPLAPAIVALNSILHAVFGDVARSQALARKAMTAARTGNDPRTTAQVLCRCSLAAYYRGDYDEGRDLALDAASVLEVEAAYSAAAASYSVAATLAQDWNQNGELAAAHYARMLKLADIAGHAALRRTALAGCFNVAAERFDETTFRAMRRALFTRPESQQHQENYSLVIADVLGFGWKGDFPSAEALLTAYAATLGISQQQRALVEALLALVAAATWDVELARSRSRTALKRTASSKHEPLHERRSRKLARLLCAATCFIIGDIVRGQRSLSGRYDPGHRYRDLFSSLAVDVSACPELFRGYAVFINVAASQARASRPKYSLTPTEAALLSVLQQGCTIAEMASEHAKSRHTIARQMESIYLKLGARNRAQAVQRARELGLI